MAKRRKVKEMDTEEVLRILQDGRAKRLRRRDTYGKIAEATGLSEDIAAALGRSILNEAAALVRKKQVSYKKPTREED